MINHKLHTIIKYFHIAFMVSLSVLLFVGCIEEEFAENLIDNGDEVIMPFPIVPNNSSFDFGIPIYTVEMAKNRQTEVNSEWLVRSNSAVNVSSEIIREHQNPFHKINFEGFANGDDYVEFVVALHGKLDNRVAIPSEFLTDISGISFRAISFEVPVFLTLEAIDISGTIIKTEDFLVNTDEMRSYQMAFTNQNLHHILLRIKGSKQDLSQFNQGSLAIDNIYLNDNTTEAFTPPLDDSQFLKWIKKSSIRYFLWNYRDLGDGRGIVLESSSNPDIVSLSGLGYAYANFILAEQEGMISLQSAKDKILSLLKWQQSQNWDNGSEGRYGFPLHYYNPNGTGKWPSDQSAISTIDWAICAAGIRVVRQKYSSDPEIVTICNELLDRPKWQLVISDDPNGTWGYNRIVKGIKATTGVKTEWVWADAFSEETELIYLEALASGKVNDLDLSRIFREEKNGYFVSWFGAGFTYNWLQLWTGTLEPYESNSIMAYQNDATTSKSNFGKPLMGLTACSTLSSISSNGFINWDKYISNQGGSVTGAQSFEVIQISPAPYGAVLALPFQPALAMQALRAYANLGYYHPLLGLPDNVRINDLPSGLNKPVPNWDSFDINVGSIAMAIEQTQQNMIAHYYRSDLAIAKSLQQLIKTF